MIYQIDTLIKIITGAPFADLGGTPTDPTMATLSIRDPTGVITSYTGGQLSHDGVGLFSYEFTPTISGIWTYKWRGTGVIQATSPDANFTIQPSIVIPG